MMREKAPSIRRSAVRIFAAVVRGLGEKMEDDLAVRRRLENGAFALEFVAQDIGVDQVAVVRDRELAAEAIDHERLRIFHRARAGGGIARVPDRARALQPLQFRRPENLRDQPHVAMQLKSRARPVRGHDPGAFLPAMLQGEKAVIGQHGRVRMAENGEDAAFVHRVGRLRWWEKFVRDHRGGKDTQSQPNVISGPENSVPRIGVSNRSLEIKPAPARDRWRAVSKRWPGIRGRCRGSISRRAAAFM